MSIKQIPQLFVISLLISGCATLEKGGKRGQRPFSLTGGDDLVR